jgi:DNA polymerase-3 subunit gamma/tau
MFALLSKGEVNESTSGTIQVQLHNCSSFDKSRLRTKKQELLSQCKSFLGKNLEIAIMSENSLPDKPDKQIANMKMMAQNHPLVIDAQRIFDGKIIN